ncbi:hypothetical protein ACFXOY_05200 [Streptomyces niveus]|uniref:hypothetical protein n=1 Tax=Streptomyces niveus TaxID=193462 RepID=UPI00368ED2DF
MTANWLRSMPANAEMSGAADLRRPWERPTIADLLTRPGGRQGFRNIRAHLACPSRVPGAKNKRRGSQRPFSDDLAFRRVLFSILATAVYHAAVGGPALS